MALLYVRTYLAVLTPSCDSLGRPSSLPKVFLILLKFQPKVTGVGIAPKWLWSSWDFSQRQDKDVKTQTYLFPPLSKPTNCSTNESF